MLKSLEKELVFFGASVAAGCKPCMDHHIEKLRVAGAADEEIRQAIADATHVRNGSLQIMQSYGLALTGIGREVETRALPGERTRIRSLVCTAAAFALNCTSSLEMYITQAQELEVTDQEISSVLDAALLVKGKAALFAEEAGQLKKEVDQLQQMLDELRETQAQLVQSEKMAALGKLVAGVVHEISNPLGVLTSATDVASRSVVILRQAIDPKDSAPGFGDDLRAASALQALYEGLPAVSEAVDRIGRTVSNLKSFAHLDEASFKAVHIHQGLDSTLALLGPTIRGSIRIIREYGDLPAVPSYPAELNQAFHALLSRAIAAIEDEGEISVETFREDDRAHVRISDSGKGMTPAEAREAFIPRFVSRGGRMEASLGLFVAYSVVQKHRGDIRVQSETGHGSVFTIVLPLDLRPELLKSDRDRI